MSKTAAPAWGLSRPPGFNRLTSQCHSGFVPFSGGLVSGQAIGAKHHGGALQAEGELVHQTDGKASTSTVEDGLPPQPALVFRRGAPSARHRKKVLHISTCLFDAAAPASIRHFAVFCAWPKSKKGGYVSEVEGPGYHGVQSP